MNTAESRRYVALIRRAGLPFREALTDYYRKFSFACTPLIVAFIASSLGSTFKKNILLMSLSRGARDIGRVLRGADGHGDPFEERLHSPFAGAWSPFTLFLVLGFMLFRTART